MDRNERQRLGALAGEVTGWINTADAALARRARILADASGGVASLRARAVDVVCDDRVAWRVVPLRSGDDGLLRAIAQHTDLPALSAADQALLTRLTTEARAATADLRALTGGRRFFVGGRRRDAGRAAAEFLGAFRDWAAGSGLPALLERAAGSEPDRLADPVADPLSVRIGLADRLADLGPSAGTVAATELVDLPEAVRRIAGAVADEVRARAAAVEAGEAVRRAETRRIVAEMPVDRLKDATRDRVRVAPLTDAGIATVWDVLQRRRELAQVPGIGQTTAVRVLGAAQTLWQTTYEEMPTRIDIGNRAEETTQLLRRLAAWDALRGTPAAAGDLAYAAALTPLARALDRDVRQYVVFAAAASGTDAFRAAVEAVTNHARRIAAAAHTAASADPWDDFLRRPADYFAMLAELGFLTEDEEKTHGDLPDDIIAAVRRLALDNAHLKASLRGYQSFAARFALVQRKVIIGDEMGLGKTVEALAVLAHLRARGTHHSLVICPAAVVTNWVREVSAKSTLRPHRLHGPGREAAVRDWVRGGGVAVTTFETLAWLERQDHGLPDLGCVVVDEAHYIKNPAARRSARTKRMIDAAEHTVLLTGTPLENRIDEFCNLVGYLRPDLVLDPDEPSPRRFRRQVAPAYLRRNQEDVLTELPELVEVEEWLPMSRRDAAAYRDAVASGNFMAMRQAAMLQGGESEKVRRLVDIVAEAEDNGRRVIVFSHFRQVLEQVARALPGTVFGPLTGAVPAAARQDMVDQFAGAGAGAALVAQIVAGGVGLNIQAASVVVICEPQLKPTTEWQAVARARRMGQLQSVQVHRLLSEDGVDQRITEILARKRALFENFARVSDTAESAPEAYDVSEAQLARDVIAAERERLFATGTPSASTEVRASA